MDEIVVRHLRGEATELEERRMERWRSESPEKEEEYQRIRSLWVSLDHVRWPEVRPPPSVTEMIGREGRARRRGSEPGRPGFGRLGWSWVAVAAAAIAAGILLPIRHGRVPREAEPSLAIVESVPGPGDIRTLALSDGSLIRIAKETRIRFPPAEGQREVVLDGRAFFGVSPGPTPFVVRTPVGEIRVQGTRFEAVTEGDLLRLVVVEGIVSLRGSAGWREVRAGEVASLRRGGAPVLSPSRDVWAVLDDWPGGLLVFQETPLSQIVLEVGRHFGVEITTSDRELGMHKISAWFEDESLDEVLTTLCITVGAEFTRVGDSVAIWQ